VTRPARLASAPLRLLRAALRLILRIVLGAFILLDELVRPIYRPLIAYIAKLRITEALSRWIAARSPWTILVLLVIPYAIVEPLKIVALLWIAHGAVRLGILTTALAHLLSFVVIERIFTAGKPKLMTIPHLARIIDMITALRRAIVGWLRLDVLKREARVVLRRLMALLR